MFFRFKHTQGNSSGMLLVSYLVIARYNYPKISIAILSDDPIMKKIVAVRVLNITYTNT